MSLEVIEVKTEKYPKVTGVTKNNRKNKMTLGE